MVCKKDTIVTEKIRVYTNCISGWLPIVRYLLKYVKLIKMSHKEITSI